MKKIFTLFFAFSFFSLLAQNLYPPNSNFSSASMKPCPFDSTLLLLQADDWFIYQTLDDTWNGVMDSTKCLGVKDTLGKLIIELDQIDINKPVFVKNLMNDSTKVSLQPDWIYDGFASIEISDETFVNFSPNCENGFCTGVIFGIEVPDSAGTSTVIRSHIDPSESTTDEYYDLCVVTEGFDEIYLKEVVFKFKLLNSTSEGLWFRPQNASLYGADEYFIHRIDQDTFVYNYHYNSSDSSYNVGLFDIGIGEYPDGGNYILTYNDTTYPNPQDISYLDLTPFDNDTFQTTINIYVEYEQTLYPQPFTQFRGGLIEGNDSTRHNISIINNGGDFCFSEIGIDVIFEGRSNYIHHGGDIKFGAQTSCLLFKSGASFILADDTYFEYGKNGMGMLVLGQDGTIKLGKNSTLLINNRMVLVENPALFGTVDNQQIYMELNEGSTLAFGEQAYLTNHFSIDRNMKLNIYMNGGILDDSKLSPDELEVINLIYPTPPEVFRENVKVFPNPTSDRLTFSMILENENRIEIEAYDLAGRFVFSKIENGQKGKNDFQIQVSDLSKGVYFFKIKTELGEAIEKVMVF